MSDTQSPNPQAFDSYNHNSEFLKQQQNLDFLSFIGNDVDVLAPHPDLFESDIDSNLASFTDQLQLFTVDSNDAYNYFRSEKPQWQGPLSTITVSSDSYDSLSNHSESFYNEPFSASQPDTENQLFDFTDLDMDFQRVSVGSDYASVSPSLGLLDNVSDPTSFGTLPPTPPISPPAVMNTVKAAPYTHAHRSSYSDYGAPSRRRPSTATSSDYYPSLGYTPSLHPTVAPTHTIASVSPDPMDESKDPRKKYKCSACPRAFARAYNLKTHMATHDANRLKPYVCPQRSCGRSFSRKHDLGRHLISIHRDEAVGNALLPGVKKAAIGVESGARSWCESCGKGYVGRNPGCDCADIK